MLTTSEIGSTAAHHPRGAESAGTERSRIHLDPRTARLVLGVALVMFAAQAWYFAGANAPWREECATHAAPPPLQLITDDGAPRVSGICDGASWIVSTDQRPQMVLCAAGLAWPIFITHYSVGVHYWPLQLLRPIHHGDPVALRRTAIPIGLGALVLLFVLVERLGDPLRAAATVATAVVTPSFLLLHSVLVSFEVVPELLIVCAALVVVLRPDPTRPPTPRRAAVVGAIAALAILANVKAAVVGLPLLAFALFESPVLRRTPARAWLAAVAVAALLMAPFAVALYLDPVGHFAYEVHRRIGIAASRLDPRLLVAEILNGIIFAGDFQAYGDIVLNQASSLRPATLVIVGLAFVFSSAQFIAALLRRPHDRVAAGCGAILLFFLLFVWLAYNQTPGANYSPVTYAHVTAMGCAIVAGGRWLGQRIGSPRLGVTAMLMLALVSLAANTYRRGDPRNLALSMNLEAVRALGDHLQRMPGGIVVSTSYNLAGLTDSLTGQPSLSIDQRLERCAGERDAEACERNVVSAVIGALPGARFLVPLRQTVIDKPSAWRAAATIEQAAQRLGLRVREEARFTTRQGTAVLALLAIEGPSSDPVAAH